LWRWAKSGKRRRFIRTRALMRQPGAGQGKGTVALPVMADDGPIAHRVCCIWRIRPDMS
jgi:hypothetical protein